MGKSSLKDFWNAFFFKEMENGRYRTLRGARVPAEIPESSFLQDVQKVSANIRRKEWIFPTIGVAFAGAAGAAVGVNPLLVVAIERAIYGAALWRSEKKLTQLEDESGLDKNIHYFDRRPRSKESSKKVKRANFKMRIRTSVGAFAAGAVSAGALYYTFNASADTTFEKAGFLSAYMVSGYVGHYTFLRAMQFHRYYKSSIGGLFGQWGITESAPQAKPR